MAQFFDCCRQTRPVSAVQDSGLEKMASILQNVGMANAETQIDVWPASYATDAEQAGSDRLNKAVVQFLEDTHWESLLGERQKSDADAASHAGGGPVFMRY